MSTVSGVGASTDAASSITGGGPMGEQQFLQLLVAQLQNQDPLSPMDNSQFVSQLAQFSALQQEQANGATQQSLLANDQLALGESMVGHTISYDNGTSGQQDVVLGVLNGSAGVQLMLQSGASAPLASVTSVY